MCGRPCPVSQQYLAAVVDTGLRHVGYASTSKTCVQGGGGKVPEVLVAESCFDLAALEMCGSNTANTSHRIPVGDRTEMNANSLYGSTGL